MGKDAKKGFTALTKIREQRYTWRFIREELDKLGVEATEGHLSRVASGERECGDELAAALVQIQKQLSKRK